MNQDQIKEINQHISDALEQWSAMTTLANADQWAYYLNYSDADLLNAFIIFFHVWSNRAIKTEQLTIENAIEKVHEFKHAVYNTFGIDTIELTNKTLKE